MAEPHRRDLAIASIRGLCALPGLSHHKQHRIAPLHPVGGQGPPALVQLHLGALRSPVEKPLPLLRDPQRRADLLLEVRHGAGDSADSDGRAVLCLDLYVSVRCGGGAGSVVCIFSFLLCFVRSNHEKEVR